MYRFLQRLWRNIVDEETGELRGRRRRRPTTRPRRLLHRTIDVVRSEIEALRFNTAIAKLIELNNHLTKASAATPREVAEAAGADGGAVRPAPRRGAVAPPRPRRARSPTCRSPIADPALLVEDTVEYPVQVNGKVRGHITVAADADADDGRGGRARRPQGRRRRSTARRRRRSSSSPAAWSTSSCDLPDACATRGPLNRAASSRSANWSDISQFADFERRGPSDRFSILLSSVRGYRWS